MFTIDDNFYKDETQEEAPQEPEKLRIGEEEYTPEEAQKLISLGKIGKEAEEKFNTSLDKVYPEFTKKSQELAEFRKEREERERQALQQKQASGAELTAEEQREMGRRVISDWGYVTKEEAQASFDEMYQQRRQAEKILDQTSGVIREAKEKYGIDTTEEKLLTFMAADKEADPKRAFSKLYDPLIKSWEEKQLQDNKPNGLLTESASTAGAKQPTETRPTRANLADQVLESLTRRDR